MTCLAAAPCRGEHHVKPASMHSRMHVHTAGIKGSPPIAWGPQSMINTL